MGAIPADVKSFKVRIVVRSSYGDKRSGVYPLFAVRGSSPSHVGTVLSAPGPSRYPATSTVPATTTATTVKVQ